MQVGALVDQLAEQGRPLAEAAARAGWDATVPRTEWTVRELVTHLGGVHRWAADVVGTASTELGGPLRAAVGCGPGDDELTDWFLVGHADLVEQLRRAPSDLQTPTFLPAASPLHFWARRQAHETAIHRADVQAAAGETAVFAPDLAQDGIAELLQGFGGRRANAVAEPGTLGLRACDGPSWLVTFGGERIASRPADDLPATDATVRGTSTELYLWLWNRDSTAAVTGDPAVAARWGQRVRVTWA